MNHSCQKHVYLSISKVEVIDEHTKHFNDVVKYCEESGQKLSMLKS